MTDEPDWEALARRPWRRVKWRRSSGAPASEVCAAFGTPIHRTGTYYLRPAYTDGELWLSQRAYEAMVRHTEGRRPPRRYGFRSERPDDPNANGGR